MTALGGDNAPLTIGRSIPTVVATRGSQRRVGWRQFLNYLGETVGW